MLNCYLQLFVSWCAEAEVVPEPKKKRKKVVKRVKVRDLSADSCSMLQLWK